MERGNLSVMCGGNLEIKKSYLAHIANKGIQHRVITYENKAIELYGTLKLVKPKRERVVRQCIVDLDNYLLEGQNVFFDIPLSQKKDRINFLYARRKMMRVNNLKCWCSLMVFDNDIEMPEEDEGWNDILIYKNDNFTVLECHKRLVM